MSQCGWKYKDLVERLEVKRKVKSAVYWKRKSERAKKNVDARNS